MSNKLNFDLFKPFSNPFAVENSSIYSLIANVSAKNIVRIFHEKHVTKIIKSSPDISSYFLRFDKLNLPINICWDPIIGKLEKFLQEEDLNLNNYLVDIMCYLSIKGIFLDWKLELNVQGDLFFDIYTIKNCSYSFICHDSKKKCLTFIDKEDEFCLFYSTNDTRGNKFFTKALRTNKQYPLMYAYLHDSRDEIIQYLPDFLSLPKPLRHKNKVNEGLNILKNHVPEYFYWVINITKQVIIYNSPSHNQIKSGSWFDLPGIYNFSVNHEPLLIAEMLIHESSHQYFNLLKRFSDVAVSTDVIYYSPAVKKMRPLWLILLAYHAFANVLIFYRILAQQTNIDKYQVKLRTLELEPLVFTLEEHLVNSRKINGLTPIGSSIFEPLYEKLRERIIPG